MSGNSKKQGSILSNNLIRASIHVTVIAALAAASAAAQAQEAPASSDQPALQEVVVTGSMIKRTDAETAEAVTIIKADDLKAQGITTTEQLVAQIMSNQAGTAFSTASAVTTWTGGGSFASLRGLGSSRTLVLLDGQRLANNVILGAGIDLNTIPASAIDHVEVLREGASSLYGSDAIAGVINIITKKNYDQGEISVNFDHPQHAGGGSGDAEITFGKGNLASDGYNFMITGSYSKQQELTARILSWPGGQIIVGAVAVGILAVAFGMGSRGVRRSFMQDLETQRLAPTTKTWVEVVGSIGFVAKGVAFGVVGGLVLTAAIEYNPKKAGGLDAALKTLAAQPFGVVLLVVVALGLAAYGIYCFIEGWYRKA